MSEDPTIQPAVPPAPEVDEAQLRYALDQIRAEQSLPMGALAGAAAALVGAGAWAAMTTLAHFQIGWMAVGVGFLVGFAVRAFGKGLDRTFGVVGATMALLGCALGNLLAVCGMIAASRDLSFLAVLSRLTPAIVRDLMVASFQPMDVLFYGIAVYEGYRLSIRRVTQQELAARVAGVPAGKIG